MGVCGKKFLGTLSNSEAAIVVEAGSEGIGISLMSMRGTTQTGVKVPKCWLSVKDKGCPCS